MPFQLDAAGLKRQVRALASATDDDVSHYLAAGQAAVTAEVADIADVPAAVADACVVRVVSHMRQSEQQVGQIGAHGQKFAGSSMRLSGARATLGPWLSQGI